MRCERLSHRCAGSLKRLAISVALGFGLTLASPYAVEAATVRGILLGGDGRPDSVNQIYFENGISGDVFLDVPGSDGAFGADLPPGVYNLRIQQGLILVAGIVVEEKEVDVGKVNEPSSFSPMHFFQHQRVAPAMIEIAAPSTAYLVTTREIAEQPVPSRFIQTATRGTQTVQPLSAVDTNPMLTEPPLEPQGEIKPVQPFEQPGVGAMGSEIRGLEAPVEAQPKAGNP
jgi:hypothetical protein